MVSSLIIQKVTFNLSEQLANQMHPCHKYIDNVAIGHPCKRILRFSIVHATLKYASEWVVRPQKMCTVRGSYLLKHFVELICHAYERHVKPSPEFAARVYENDNTS